MNGTQFSVYRPELDSWSNNQLQCRAVMAVRTGTVTDNSGNAAEQYRYGVVWLKARSETDTQGRLVTLNDVTVTKVNFPTAREQEAQYQSMLQSVMAGKSLVVSLDQMEAALAIANSRKAQSLQVNNAPPDIIFSFAPAVLVHVDGEPVWRASGVAGVEKAINTRALLLRYQGRFYLGYADHWAVPPRSIRLGGGQRRAAAAAAAHAGGPGNQPGAGSAAISRPIWPKRSRAANFPPSMCGHIPPN